MRVISKRPGVSLMLAMLAASASAGLYAQEESAANPSIVVDGVPQFQGELVKGPEVKGVITARTGSKVKVRTADGNSTVIAFNETTKIKGGSGKPNADALLNGLPVTVKTLQEANGSSGALLASQISFKGSDLKTATMIRNGTDQRFAEQSAATESLRGRIGDIDKYNVKAVTNVHFDTGKTVLSEEDKAQLCSTAASAGATDNALLLVVGYTDAVGSDDYNQELSEKRAGRVINYLQQNCGWKPYRMLTPTGMAKADPAASNDTPEGKAQNRRVAVNVLVSKSVDEL